MLVILSHVGVLCSAEVVTSARTRACNNTQPKAYSVEWSSRNMSGKNRAYGKCDWAHEMFSRWRSSCLPDQSCSFHQGASPAALFLAVIFLLAVWTILLRVCLIYHSTAGNRHMLSIPNNVTADENIPPDNYTNEMMRKITFFLSVNQQVNCQEIERVLCLLNKSSKLGQADHFITQIANKVLHPLITSNHRGWDRIRQSPLCLQPLSAVHQRAATVLPVCSLLMQITPSEWICDYSIDYRL